MDKKLISFAIGSRAIRLKARRVGWSREDLEQEAWIASEHARKTFDPSRGRQFWTYAVLVIRRLVMRALENSELIRVPPSTVLYRAKRDPVVFPHYAGLSENQAQAPEEPDLDLKRAWGELSDKQRKVLRERFADEREAKDIARDLGVCRQRVWQIEQAALATLRKGLAA